MINKTEIVPKSSDTMTFFESAFASIKSDLCDIANYYLNIAYKVYEIDVRIRKDGKKCKYKNIVEACEIELGFKKSTTYNMLNIVHNYGMDSKGIVSYKQLLDYSSYSYSQLVEMLSLGSDQRAQVKPDTPVSAIRLLKKSTNKEPKTKQASEKISEPSASFQTSGNSDDECIEALKVSFSDSDIDTCFSYSLGADPDLFIEFNGDFLRFFDSFTSDLCDLYDTFTPLWLDADVDMFDPDDLEKRFSFIMHVYRSAYSAIKKQQDLGTKFTV